MATNKNIIASVIAIIMIGSHCLTLYPRQEAASTGMTFSSPKKEETVVNKLDLSCGFTNDFATFLKSNSI